MKETEKLLEIAKEVCDWLYTVRGMIAAEYAKDLAKQISRAEVEIKERVAKEELKT